MTDRYVGFRLDFEQQQKRAKELLKAARAGDPAAVVRFKSATPKLAEAQFLIGWLEFNRARYDKALPGLTELIARYPKSEFADDAT